MAKVLVIAPHALDEVLGCGGTLALHCDAGDDVEVLVLFGDGTGADKERRIAAPRAAEILGTPAPRFAGLPENRSDTLPLGDIIGTVEKTIATFQPAIMYVPHVGNLNIDHQTAHRAAVTAARPAPGQAVRAIYSYEILSSTDWAPPQTSAPFLPTRFVDVTRAVERKMRALEAYACDMRLAPHARSLESIATLAKSRGYGVGLPAAEAFMVMREILSIRSDRKL